MKVLLKHLGLLLLLLTAQQGAVVHELGHLVGAEQHAIGGRADFGDASCSLCPAFAQVATPACSHSLPLPALARAAPEQSVEPRSAVLDIAPPQPRSRGPPDSV